MNYDKKIQIGKYEIQISTTNNYGFFEHDDYGDECAGGLWFDDYKKLEDFDGLSVLPKEVIQGILKLGFFCDEDLIE